MVSWKEKYEELNKNINENFNNLFDSMKNKSREDQIIAINKFADAIGSFKSIKTRVDKLSDEQVYEMITLGKLNSVEKTFNSQMTKYLYPNDKKKAVFVISRLNEVDKVLKSEKDLVYNRYKKIIKIRQELQGYKKQWQEKKKK